MRTSSIHSFLGYAGLFVACGITTVAWGQTRTIRVVSYNIQDDTGGNTTPLPGLIAPSSGGSVTNGGVLEGIGEEILGSDPAQPIDILTLQETTSNSTTIQPIVDGLNAFYSSRNIAAGYAMSTYQATQFGGNTGGNGPNALVYNTNTLQLIASVGVGTPGGSANGEYRQVVRYEFAPAGVTATTNNEFYVYVSHYKSGTIASDVTARNGEATIIRNDVATLPSNARVLFTGDFNASNSGEAMYQTLVAAGVNQAYDVLNPTGATTNNWGSSTTSTGILAALSESAPNLRYRDDYQMMTSNVLYGVAGGLAYVPGTYHVFGNNGTTPYNGTVNSGGNTSLNGNLTTNMTGITATQLYQYLTTASDHLPVVADYTVPIAAPASPQSIQTVFIILMENHDWAEIRGNTNSAPYINNTLLPMASRAEQYYNPPGLHPSLPNYLWLEAGTNFNVTSDVLPSSGHQSSTNHLVTLLNNAGISWTSYQEDITGASCPLTNVTKYATKHNPMVYFDDVTNTNNAGSVYCIANVRPYTELPVDLQSNTVTRYNFITPNLTNDMHDSAAPVNDSIRQGDNWLAAHLPAILNSPAYSNNGAIFITWDEGEAADGPIGMIVLSPLAKGGGYSNTVHYTHSSTLRTMQEIFNVGPLLGDATNATDLSDLFVFGGQLAVSPASGLSSTGGVGGAFSPSNQVYTLSNTGGVAIAWAASKTVNWLTLSITNGTLAPSATTNITVSINTNANSLTAGLYTDTVSFSNMTSSAGNTTRAVSLTVNSPSALLAVSPASGLSSAGVPGGPFSPTGQAYTVSNIGGLSMDWSASKSVTWVTLSLTNGTLAPSASTNVIVSLNANANSLAAGNYSATVTFTNTTNGAGTTTRAVSLNVSSFGFFDDFSTFSSGNLAGQHSWAQLGGSSTSPIQISSGQAVIPGLPVNSGDNQDVYKGFTNEVFAPVSGTNTFYFGVSITVTSAATTPAFLLATTNLVGASNFPNFRLTAKDNGNSTYSFGGRVNAQNGYPFVYGSALSYGSNYMVIVEVDMIAGNANDLMRIFVNPTSAILGAQTTYAVSAYSSGSVTDPPSEGALQISQFSNASTGQDGARISKVVVADSFTTAYTSLLGAQAPVALFTGTPTSGAAPLNVTFTDTSTGTISNRFWDFGDSATTNVTTNVVVHTYAAGTYTVSLTVSGLAGANTNSKPNYITALTAFQAWQIQYFGSTNNSAANPNADADGDGQNNLAEFLTGTDPTNTAAYFHILSIVPENNDLRITWATGPGRTNAAQFTTGNYNTNFVDVFIVTNTTGTVTNFLDLGAGTNNPSGYYRIRLVP